MKCMSLNANSTCSSPRQHLLGETTSPVPGHVANLLIVILSRSPKLGMNKLHQQDMISMSISAAAPNSVSLSSFVARQITLDRKW